MGEWTVERQTIAAAGWTVKPLGQIFSHPLFSPRGAAFFLRSFIKTLWRGEFLWHGSTMGAGPMDFIYVGSTCLFLAACAFALRSRKIDRLERAACLGALSALVAFLAELALTSIRFDFGAYPYPSRAIPFLFSGRLALGVLIPFLMLYLRGLKTLTSRLGDRARLILVGVFCAAMAASQFKAIKPAFSSRYNWFHLPSDETDIEMFCR